MGEITVKSYNGDLVNIPEEEKDEYLKNQRKIKKYLEEGKSKKDILELLKNE